MKIRPQAFLFLLALSVCSFAQDGAKKAAPDFEVTTVAGKKLKLEELKGKYVVLNFWFIHCPPCLNEIPQLNKLVTAYGKRNFVFVGFARDDKYSLDSFLKRKPFTYQIIPNSGDVIKKYIAPDHDDMRYPTHVIIDKDGNLEFRTEGASGLMALQKELKRLAALK